MNSGKVVQVSTSNGGVPKWPIGTARVTRLGIHRDQHRYHLHGGPDKALLLMSCEVIDNLAAEGFRVSYGALGENLTVAGLPHQEWRTGLLYRIGEILIQLTSAREPCSKLKRYGTAIEKRLQENPGESGF